MEPPLFPAVGLWIPPVSSWPPALVVPPKLTVLPPAPAPPAGTPAVFPVPGELLLLQPTASGALTSNTRTKGWVFEINFMASPLT
jgi:hypothetical protein